MVFVRCNVFFPSGISSYYKDIIICILFLLQTCHMNIRIKISPLKTNIPVVVSLLSYMFCSRAVLYTMKNMLWTKVWLFCQAIKIFLRTCKIYWLWRGGSNRFVSVCCHVTSWLPYAEFMHLRVSRATRLSFSAWQMWCIVLDARRAISRKSPAVVVLMSTDLYLSSTHWT